jgi:hypothetical protein
MGHRRRQVACFATAGIAWSIAVSLGFIVLAWHGSTPGAAGDPTGRWPASSRVLANRGRANLVLMAHPRSPCTRATIAELGRIMSRCRDDVTAHVLFLRPGGVEGDWEETDLWRAAAAIPGTRVLADRGGIDAARFGVATSGHVLLYNANGALLYSGGITGARVHEGDNPGRDAVISLLTRGRADRARSAVFGCPLSGAPGAS